jgi:hypothetical protein
MRFEFNTRPSHDMIGISEGISKAWHLSCLGATTTVCSLALTHTSSPQCWVPTSMWIIGRVLQPYLLHSLYYILQAQVHPKSDIGL